MPDLTPQNIVRHLEKPEALSRLLKLEDFAEPEKLADKLAQGYKDKLKATQLRRFFHTLKDIERGTRGYKDSDTLPAEIRNKLLPIMPELAYARGRDLIPDDFYRLLRVCLSVKKLPTIGDFRLLVSFLTAILAYHKFHEKGKDKAKEKANGTAI
ncbi:MAG: type III-A CRISPR-associated protein Csm2 [Anaerolineae bacterium]|nr:type III-A CRISPR-associated protein Csm2 [Anaerolineae bacterium]